MAMGVTLRTRIIRIGNSQGIRIPRTVIQQLQLGTDVELEIEGEQLVIRRAGSRQGWEQAFQRMAASRDDRILRDAPSSLTRWDEEEWEW